MDDSTNMEGNFLLAIKGTINKPAKFTASQFSEAEQELIAAINAINSSKTFVSQSVKESPIIPLPHPKSKTTSDIGEEKREISLETAIDSDIVMTEEDDEKPYATKTTNTMVEEAINYVKKIQMKLIRPQLLLLQHSPRISLLTIP
jgi:DNA topoisomerase VI subunit B